MRIVACFVLLLFAQSGSHHGELRTGGGDETVCWRNDANTADVCMPLEKIKQLVPPSPSALRLAFLDHWKHNLPDEQIEINELGANVVMSQRWAQYQRESKVCPAIAEVVEVKIDKTADGGVWVIQMRGPKAQDITPDNFEKLAKDNDTCSLWMTAAGEGQNIAVRDFSPY